MIDNSINIQIKKPGGYLIHITYEAKIPHDSFDKQKLPGLPNPSEVVNGKIPEIGKESSKFQNSDPSSKKSWDDSTGVDDEDSKMDNEQFESFSGAGDTWGNNSIDSIDRFQMIDYSKSSSDFYPESGMGEHFVRADVSIVHFETSKTTRAKADTRQKQTNKSHYMVFYNNLLIQNTTFLLCLLVIVFIICLHSSQQKLVKHMKRMYKPK